MSKTKNRCTRLTNWLTGAKNRPLLVAALLALAGCGYQDGALDNPLERRFQWFSFVAGEDIRKQCGPGTVDRYRLVYNGFWREEVRTYEISTAGEGRLEARILGPSDFWTWTSGDLLAPWRGDVTQRTFGSVERQALRRHLAESGWQDPPPVGTRLPSDGFYWTAVACENGHFRFNAWLFPSERFRNLTFAGYLAGFDGHPLDPPDPIAYAAKYDQPHLAAERWWITVGRDGLL